MQWLIGIISLVVGVVIGYLVAERKCGRKLQAQQTAASVAEQRLADMGEQMQQALAETRDARDRCGQAEQRCAGLTAELRAAEQNFIEQKKLLDDAQTKLREAFAGLSAEALAKNNEAFLQLAGSRFATLTTEAAGSLDKRKIEIETLLKPMTELLGQYQRRLGEIEKSRIESYTGLQQQIGALQETERTLNVNTTQLVSALRRPTTRGQWGEMTLRRLVELSGMSNRCDFTEQATIQNQDNRQRPDMIIHLPGGFEIVVDCKTTLDAALDAAAENDDEKRKAHFKRHADQVRSRARDLCSKSYWSQFENAPEYVVMFLPGESFYSSAVEADADLFEDCLKSHVIVATPTTLLALLKTAAHIWKQHDMTENAEHIRKLGVEIYERVQTVLAYFQKLGDSIGAVIMHYNQAIGSMETRLTVSARKMGELGARNEKPLPELKTIDERPREVRALSVGSNNNRETEG